MSISQLSKLENTFVMPVSKYIRENWGNTIRGVSSEGKSDSVMPKPFSTPSIEPLFSNFYYWDTYFINIGLIVDGLLEQAKNNLTNIAFFIRRMGYMPNANHLPYSSQPPLFTRAVYDFWKKTGDNAIVIEYLDAVLIEYNFFMNNRMTEIGLNQYRCMPLVPDKWEEHYAYFSNRVGIHKNTEMEKRHFTENMFAVCESGWDCSPCYDSNDERFAMHKYVQLTLNCLLYDAEKKIAEMYRVVGDLESALRFEGNAKTRKQRMDTYMLDRETGLYCNYNFKDGCRSTIVSTAAIYPYVVGIANEVKPLKKVLSQLELEYGVSICAYREAKEYLQWDYPLMWAPEMYFVYSALMNNGLREDAKRIAGKYLKTVERNFSETGIIWEKYNAKTGKIGAAKDSRANPMLGWSAAIYQYFLAEQNN